MWICRERKREKKKTNTEATGRLAQIWPIQRGTETDRESNSKSICVLDLRQTGGCGLKWVAEVVSNMSMHAKISLYASECICVCCVCWTTITPFQSVCPTDEQHDRQADSSEESQTDVGLWLEPSQLKQSRPDRQTVWESVWLVTDRTGDWAVFTVLSALSTLPLSPLAAAPKTQDSS